MEPPAAPVRPADRGSVTEPSQSADGAHYVALIADGSRRWAASRGRAALEGHRAGMDIALERVRDAVELGIRELTLFVLSTENWRRPATEIDGLTALAAPRIADATQLLAQDGVQMRFIGAPERLPGELVAQMRRSEALTAANSTLKLFLAFNYGGRKEIEDAALGYARDGDRGFAEHLYAPDMHDPDVLIRTGGDKRLSNFMLWRLAYTELVFRDEMWPDFTRECLEASLAEFAGRRRRFGGS